MGGETYYYNQESNQNTYKKPMQIQQMWDIYEGSNRDSCKQGTVTGKCYVTDLTIKWDRSTSVRSGKLRLPIDDFKKGFYWVELCSGLETSWNGKEDASVLPFLRWFSETVTVINA